MGGSAYGRVVRQPVLRRVLPGLLVSALGDGMSMVAVAWLAVQIAPPGREGVWTGLAVAAYSLPATVGAAVFGRWVRGFTGTRLVAVDATLRAVALGTIAVLAVAGSLAPAGYVALLAVSSLLHAWGSAGTYTLIAEQLPEDDRVAGNALVSTFTQAALVVGPALAGGVTALTGAGWVIGADALSFAVLAVSCWLVSRRHTIGRTLNESPIHGPGDPPISILPGDTDNSGRPQAARSGGTGSWRPAVEASGGTGSSWRTAAAANGGTGSSSRPAAEANGGTGSWRTVVEASGATGNSSRPPAETNGGTDSWRPPAEASGGTGSSSRPAAEAGGWRTIVRQPRLLGLIAVTCVFFFLYGPVEVALPIHVATEMHGSPGLLGLFWTVFGVGAVVGGLGASLLRNRPLWAVVVVIIVGWGAALLPLGLSDAALPGLIGFAVGGLIYGPFTAICTALFQRACAPHMLSRVLATRTALTTPSTAVGMLIGGPVVSAVGGQSTLLASAVLTIALGVVVVLFTSRMSKPAPEAVRVSQVSGVG